jgi:pimeloyl-ACP methyl ester carboxylesterase
MLLSLPGLLATFVFAAPVRSVFAGDAPAAATGRWGGAQRLDFVVNGRPALLVSPKSPAPGRPWIWRTEFFGAFPSVDLALLEKGWHVAYINVQNLYGAPAAMDAMDGFYAEMIARHRLAPKVVPEGFSRGGLYAFNWAARNPAKVAALYVDAPVCDFKSWPAGKGKGTGSPADWQRCLKAYGFTEEQALAYKFNPVDNLALIASARIPIIAVAGDADTTVPLAENIGIVETRYRALCGEIQVIVKPGVGHHPHSLADPAPVVDFLLAHFVAP